MDGKSISLPENFRFILPGTSVAYGVSLTDREVLRFPGSYGDGFVVSWILTGHGSFEENGKSYPIRGECVCLRRPGRDYKMSLDRVESRRLFFDLPDEFYPTFALLIPELDSLPPIIPCPFRKAFSEEFFALGHELRLCRAENLYRLIPNLIHFISGITGILENRVESPIVNGRVLLEDAGSTLTLPEIAEKCGMTYDSFRKLFASTYGIPPGKFRNANRLESAKNSLRMGESIKSVAARLGFADVCSFTHWFSLGTGIPPGKFIGQMM